MERGIVAQLRQPAKWDLQGTLGLAEPGGWRSIHGLSNHGGQRPVRLYQTSKEKEKAARLIISKEKPINP